MAPELIRHERYSEKVDVWSLGVIVYQLLSGLTPFDGRNIKKINNNICHKTLTFSAAGWQKISSQAKQFILACLERDQTKRPSVKELFEHAWIKSMDSKRQAGPDEGVQLNI